MFYQEIKQRPQFLLSRFLPVPIRTDGCKSEGGGEVKCQYVGGHLLKRVTPARHRANQQFASFD